MTTDDIRKRLVLKVLATHLSANYVFIDKSKFSPRNWVLGVKEGGEGVVVEAVRYSRPSFLI